MTSDAQAAFERGKSHFDKNENVQAEREFVEAVRLAPDNAEYHGWLARSLSALEKREQALAEAERALQLDPNCAVAYFVRGREQEDQDRAIQEYTRAIELAPTFADAYHNRGRGYRLKGDYDRAIQDLSRAIELDPKNASAYANRSDAYQLKGDTENYVADTARYHALGPVERYSGETPSKETDAICSAVHDHLTRVALSSIKKAGEKFVDYYPCTLIWGEDTSQRWYRGTSNNIYHGQGGVGYICLTDQNVHIFSLGDLSRQYIKGTSILLKGVFAMFGNFDLTSAEKQDTSWTIPYGSVTGVQRTEHAVQLATAKENWEIGPVFSNHYACILTAINMGRAGKLAHIWDPPKPQIAAPSATPAAAETLQLLAQLGDLRDKGILTEEELQEKKRKLLDGI